VTFITRQSAILQAYSPQQFAILGENMPQGTITTINSSSIRLTYKKPGPKPLPPEAKGRRVKISLSPHWHQIGKELAKKQGISFSKYVELLVYQDSLCNKSAE
jgi:hypothetical protein